MSLMTLIPMSREIKPTPLSDRTALRPTETSLPWMLMLQKVTAKSLGHEGGCYFEEE